MFPMFWRWHKKLNKVKSILKISQPQTKRAFINAICNGKRKRKTKLPEFLLKTIQTLRCVVSGLNELRSQTKDFVKKIYANC